MRKPIRRRGSIIDRVRQQQLRTAVVRAERELAAAQIRRHATGLDIERANLALIAARAALAYQGHE